MKKPLIYTLIGGACLVASTGLTLIANGIESAVSTNSNTTLVATSEDNTLNITPKSFTTNETVYVITDHAGQAAKSFVGSTINTSTEPIPIDLHITYTLDGTDITAEDLAGKSGHVKITYDYTATKSYNGKQIPFLTVTGLSLDSHKFTNLKLINGKIINETEDSTLLAGYAIAGLNENLGIDVLPSSFTLEADVTDFSLDTTYTFATNEIFADLDTSKLNSIDDLIAQMNQLSNGINQLIDGSNQLTSGLDSALSGSNKLRDGASALASGLQSLNNGALQLQDGATSLANGSVQLSDGINSLASGTSALSNGLTQLSANSSSLNQGATAVFNNLLSSANAKINENSTLLYLISTYQIAFPLTIANYSNSLTTLINVVTAGGGDASELTTLKGSLDNYNNFYTGLVNYTGSVDYIANQSTTINSGVNALVSQMPAFTAGTNALSEGATTLSSGTTTLLNGSIELSLGVNSLTDGLSALTTGSHTLHDGLNTFKTSGINRLVTFANHDLATLTGNLRSTLNAAKSYHHYQDASAKSVKFLLKTPSIK